MALIRDADNRFQSSALQSNLQIWICVHDRTTKHTKVTMTSAFCIKKIVLIWSRDVPSVEYWSDRYELVDLQHRINWRSMGASAWIQLMLFWQFLPPRAGCFADCQRVPSVAVCSLAASAGPPRRTFPSSSPAWPIYQSLVVDSLGGAASPKSPRVGAHSF